MMNYSKQVSLLGKKWGDIDIVTQLDLLSNSSVFDEILDLTQYLSIPITLSKEWECGYIIDNNSIVYSPCEEELHNQLTLETLYPLILVQLKNLIGEEFNTIGVTYCIPVELCNYFRVLHDVKKCSVTNKLYTEYQCYFNFFESYIITIIVNYDTNIIEDVY